MAPPDAETTGSDEAFVASELQDAWHILSAEERVEGFRLLPRADAEELFFTLGSRDQYELILGLPTGDRRSWLRLLPPDDAADVIQEAHEDERAAMMAMLDEQTRKEVTALLAYAEDDAGGLMNPRYVRVRPDMTVDEAISYLRKQARERIETLAYAYVCDAHQKLLGVCSFRDLFAAQQGKLVRDVMKTDLITVLDTDDQEAVSRVFSQHEFVAVPVIDADGRMKGIVTVDDIVEVVQEEATEDAQKFGGMEALGAPYLDVSIPLMIKKRAGWLSALFISEMLTTTAMDYFQHELERALVLSIFISLIISSGGNSGSQASTLIVRALALGEVRLRDWWRVFRREIFVGILLGLILGVIGFCRISLWHLIWPDKYGVHAHAVAMTVGFSVVGVVLFGSLAGSMLPFLLRRVGLDPASASAPAVATLVDVTGLVIYFTVASIVLRGILL
ncbi:MAG TPA: magnesium transporter [Polyangia bacterium]|nr:magnesium transporter [Polyangia bacterium]